VKPLAESSKILQDKFTKEFMQSLSKLRLTFQDKIGLSKFKKILFSLNYLQTKTPASPIDDYTSSLINQAWSLLDHDKTGQTCIRNAYVLLTAINNLNFTWMSKNVQIPYLKSQLEQIQDNEQ
jgi:hypothetical protein